MKRIVIIAIISGFISSVFTAMLFFFVFPSAWLFFIIPLIMGISIHKFGKISAKDVEGTDGDKLQRKVGLLCGGAVLLFLLLTVIPLVALSLYMGLGWGVLLDVPFFIVCAIAVWWGYNRGVQAVVDSYYDANLSDTEDE